MKFLNWYSKITLKVCQKMWHKEDKIRLNTLKTVGVILLNRWIRLCSLRVTKINEAKFNLLRALLLWVVRGESVVYCWDLSWRGERKLGKSHLERNITYEVKNIHFQCLFRINKISDVNFYLPLPGKFNLIRHQSGFSKY